MRDSHKRFIYDEKNFRVRCIAGEPDAGAEIHLSNLSSGEKQIVSLFSHLCLVGSEEFIIIIDEPELSLSVPWQREFLYDILRMESCNGLFAATHSPFVYEGDLERYTYGLGEFSSLRDMENDNS